MITWRDLVVSSCGTHHLRVREPAYSNRFDEVLAFHEPGLAAVRLGDEAWHIRPDGQPAYVRRFRRAFGYYGRRAAVVSEDGWHHVDDDAKDVYVARYDWCGNFQGGLCAVRSEGGVYLHITLNGAPAYQPRWRYAGDFRGGVAVVQADDGRSTHVDVQGRQVHGVWFADLDVFHKGLARARDDGGWMHVDRRGVPQYDRRFAAVEPFYNGQARVERLDGGREVIDNDGRQLVELRAVAARDGST